MENTFLIDTWSYSKVASFSRNEKAFEMQYIYREYSKMSATTIAGSAYHEALENYFKQLNEGVDLSISELESIAFDYIDNVRANKWKTQKTTPTIEKCQEKAYKVVSALIGNFYQEKEIYLSDLAEIIDVEIKTRHSVSINGVGIPMPCVAKIDLIIKTKSGKTVIIDHKSKNTFSDEKEQMFTIGKQSITYVKSYEEYSGLKIDEVWFIENKYSKNKNGNSQLQKFVSEMNQDTRKLYESLLYEPLKRMIEAVSDPDYVYMINDSDNFTDKAEIHNFWCKTMIAEIEDFHIPEDKKGLIEKRLRKIRDSSIVNINPIIIKNFKNNAAKFINYDLNILDMTNEQKIEHILKTFGIICRVAYNFDGFSSNTYLIEVSAGVKIESVMRHKLDIANALDVANIRMMKDLFVYENKSYVAIESAKKREKDLLFDPKYLTEMKIPIGVTNFSETIFWDLENQATPHMLICGATGSGKSVSIKSTIEYAELAGVENIVIFDPKYEFVNYSSRYEVYNSIEDIELRMQKLVNEMQEKAKSGQTNQKTLVVFDEFADAVAQSKKGNELNVYENVTVGVFKNGMPKTKRENTGKLKSLEENLKELLQKGRSLGYRIVAATQRASVKVITGDAKVNFPIQICFRVPKETDSRVVLDETGAEALAGKGDGLIKSPEYFGVQRFQGFFKS